MMKTGIFRALNYPNYRLYFAGQSVSQIGTWMQRTGVSWVVYTLTHSTFMLGVTVFASQFPSFLLSLYGGLISDRYNRYKVVLITQTIAMLQAIALAVLVLSGHTSVWGILVLSIILGITNAFDVPVRQPMVHQMVENKEDLPNAIALNSSMNNLARLAGPALSGLILVKFGAGICFLLNAASFVAVIVSLLLMKLPAYVSSPMKRDLQTDFKEGFAYLKDTPALAKVIIMVAMMSFLVLPYNTLLPVFATAIFKGDAATFGYISSFIGLGAVSGAYFLASRPPGASLRRILFFNTLILGAGLIFFSQISYFPVAMGFAVLCGFGTMSQTSVSNIIIQVESDSQMRGRVLSYLMTAMYGMLPLGSLAIGALSKRIGAPASLLAQGVLALLIVAAFSGSLLASAKSHKQDMKSSPQLHN